MFSVSVYPSEIGDFETAGFQFETLERWKSKGEKKDTTGMRESTLLTVVHAPTIRRPTTNAWPEKVLVKRETPGATWFSRYFEENTRGDGRYRKISFFYFSIARGQSSEFYYARARNRNFHRPRFYQATLFSDSSRFVKITLKFVEFVSSIERKTDAKGETKAKRARGEGYRKRRNARQRMSRDMALSEFPLFLDNNN